MQTTDNELIVAFLQDRDESAFEKLVQRHSGLVMSVCRSMLRHQQDAEDAFQATFLVLAKKAAGLKQRNSVGGWLYHTAVNHCLALRRRIAAKREESSMVEEPVSKSIEPWQSIARQQQWEQLHRELATLPEQYRVPILMCDIQGESRESAAEFLDRSEASIKAALARGRKLLRLRLLRRGIALSALVSASASLCSACQASTASSQLVQQTVQLAVSSLAGANADQAAETASASDAVQYLTQQGVHSMSVVSITKISTAVVLTSVLLLAPMVVLAANIFNPQRDRQLPANTLAVPDGNPTAPTAIADTAR